MASNNVAILGDTGTLNIQIIPLGGANPMEFRSGSFRASVAERRVAGVFLFIPMGGKSLELRFEFTDPAFATEDIKGIPVYVTAEDRITPYTEPRLAEKDPTKAR